MAVTCSNCGGTFGTTDDVGVEGAVLLRLTAELIKAVGPMVDSSGVDSAMDLVAYPLRELDVPCPSCDAVRWKDTR